MTVTKKIVVSLDEQKNLHTLQREVMKALKNYYTQKAQIFISKRTDIKAVGLLPRLAEKDSSIGSWKMPSVFSNDFYTFSIQFGIGGEHMRSIFTCSIPEHNVHFLKPDNEKTTFILNDFGLCDEILDVIGHACVEFGETIKFDNDNEIIKRFISVESPINIFQQLRSHYDDQNINFQK